MSRQVVSKTITAARQSETTYFDSNKNHSPPPLSPLEHIADFTDEPHDQMDILGVHV